MKQIKRNRLLGSFLKEEAFGISMYLGTMMVFYAVFFLYRSQPEPVIYATVITLFCGFIISLIRFALFAKKKHERDRMLSDFECGAKALPEADNLLEEDYRNMLTELREKCAELNTKLRANQQDAYDYYATWVHQIKTPIAVMRMMLSSEDTEEHRELEQELFRIEQYVEMVLNYIRLDESSNDLVIKKYEIDYLVRQAIRKYAGQFVRKKIKMNYDEIDRIIVTDEKWFVFLIEQILSNAVKYTATGSVTIYLMDDKLYIEDTGMGIAKEDIPRIFEKGYTGYNGRADKKSTGLGLYLCKQTCNKLNISINARSTPGEGTTIILDLNEIAATE